MRILQVVRRLAWTGGMQEYTAAMAQALTKAGHEVVILTGRPGPGGALPAAAEGLEVILLPQRRLVGRYTYQQGLVTELRSRARWADVVHAHQALAPGTIAASFTRAPLAITLNLHPEHITGHHARRRRAQLQLLLRRTDLLVAVSEAEQALASTIYRPRAQCIVWPGTEIGPSVKDRTRRPLVLSVSRLSSTKRVDLTLRALAPLREDADIAIVGDGPERDELAAECRDLGFSSSVLKGSMADADVAALFAEATVYVSLSEQEAFGISVAKAVAAGCRLVVSDIGSHREIVHSLGVDNRSLVRAQASIATLTSAVRTALTADDWVVSTRRPPTWEESARALLAGYEAILERPAPRRWSLR